MKISKKLFALFGLFFMLYVNGMWAMQLSSQNSPVSSQDSSLLSSCEQEAQNEVQQVTKEKVEKCTFSSDTTVFVQPEVDNQAKIFTKDAIRIEFEKDLNEVRTAAKILPNRGAFNITALYAILRELASSKQSRVEQ